jgi:hypothetical protein
MEWDGVVSDEYGRMWKEILVNVVMHLQGN